MALDSSAWFEKPPSLIRREAEAVRRLTSKPFGVNLIPAATDPDLLEQQLITCVELRIPVVALFWDLSVEIVGRLRDAGILVVCQVGSSKEGELAQRAGAQILIAQGVEAGGHVRGTTPLKVLLPEIIAASDVPVLAAGGIVDGGDLANALRAGTQGVVIGTAFLASPEFLPTTITNNGLYWRKGKRPSSPISFTLTGRLAPPFAYCRTAPHAAREAIPLGHDKSLARTRGGRFFFSARTRPCAR